MSGNFTLALQGEQTRRKSSRFQTKRIFLTLPRLVWHRGAPISDPARFGVLLNTCRVGDRRSGGSVKKILTPGAAAPGIRSRKQSVDQRALSGA